MQLPQYLQAVLLCLNLRYNIMQQLNENLHESDLKDLVKKVFEIDSYKSKIGDDEEIIVLSFTVESEDPAKDLENFIEMGYNFVLDADTSIGETDDGTYKVFVEIERNRNAINYILKLLDGISRLTDIDIMRFRYFKSFTSYAATKENLTKIVPLDKDSYEIATEKHMLENFTNFFSNSYLDSVELLDESIIFKNAWGSPLKFKIIQSGPKKTMYETLKGPIMLEQRDMADIMFLTKYIGNYNITKINNQYIFENKNYAVILEKLS